MPGTLIKVMPQYASISTLSFVLLESYSKNLKSHHFVDISYNFDINSNIGTDLNKRTIILFFNNIRGV